MIDFIMCRHHSKNKNRNGVLASLLQRVHRQIHAPRVCPQHAAICFIFLHICSWDGIGLLAVHYFYCSNNECPACRTHCASRRSLRDDPNYDALIAAIYPDIDKYEEEVICIFHLALRKHFIHWMKNSLTRFWPRNWLCMRMRWLGISRCDTYFTQTLFKNGCVVKKNQVIFLSHYRR